MKKSLFAFLLLITTVSFSKRAFAQGHFGVKAGVGLANLKTTEGTGDNLFSYQAGVVYYTNLDNPLFFQTGVSYTAKGLKETYLGETAKFIYDFIEIPLNVGYQIPVGNYLKISPFVGAFAAYALTAKLKGSGTTINLFDKSFGADPDRFDFGANFGVGVHVNNKIIVSAQYSHGLTNLNDVKTRATTLGLTYLF